MKIDNQLYAEFQRVVQHILLVKISGINGILDMFHPFKAASHLELSEMATPDVTSNRSVAIYSTEPETNPVAHSSDPSFSLSGNTHP